MEEINAAQPEAQELVQSPIQTPAEPKKKKLLKSKWLLLSSIILVLIIISAGAAYFFLNSKSQVSCTLEAKLCPDGSSVGRTGPKCEFAKCPAVTPTLPVTILPTPSASEAASWKTYEDKTFGFSFKYPTYFEVNDITDDYPEKNVDKWLHIRDTKLNYGNNFMDIKIINNTLTNISSNFKDKTSTIVPGDTGQETITTKVTKTDIQINNIQAIQITSVENYEYSNPSTYTFVTILIPIGNKTIEFDGSNSPYILNQILSTFKFTDQTSQADTSTWKTYFSKSVNGTNPIRFTLQYPLTCQETNAVNILTINSIKVISCPDINVEINPQALGRGAEVISKDRIKLNNYTWDRTKFKVGSSSNSLGVTYGFRLNDNSYENLIEVYYGYFSKDAESKVETIISTFKFTQ